MAGDDEVLIKIATDISDAVAAMQTMVEAVMTLISSMSDVGDQSNKTGDDVDDMHKKMAAGAEESGAATVAWGIQLSKAFDAVKKGVTDVITGLPNMVSAAAEAGDHMQTLSNRLNVSVESLAQLDYISKQSGASMEGMARTVQTMGTTLADSGSKGAKGIQSLGLSLSDLKKQKPEDAFLTILETIQKLPEGVDKNAKAMEIFGNKFRGQTMLLKENIGELQKSFKDLGGGMRSELAKEGDRWSDNLTNIHLKQEQFRDQIATAVLPALNSMIETFPALGGAVLTFGSGLVDAAKSFGPFLAQVLVMQGPAGLTGLATSISGAVMPALYGLLGAVTGISLPFIAGAAAVAALGFALYKLMGGWDGVKAAVVGAIKFFEDAWVVISHFTKEGIEYLAKKIQELREWFTRTSESTGVLSTAFKVVMGTLTGLWELLQKVYNGFASLFKGLGKWMGDLATEYRKADEAAEAHAKAEAGAAAAAETHYTALEKQELMVKQVGNAYKWLATSTDASVKAAMASVVAGTTTAKEAAAALAEQFGGDADIWQRAIDQYKKGAEELKKAGEKSPLAKLTKESKELEQALKDAAAAGTSDATVLNELGKKAADLATRALLVKGGIAQITPEIQALADKFNEVELQKILDKLHVATVKIADEDMKKAQAAAVAMMNAINAAFVATLTSIDQLREANKLARLEMEDPAAAKRAKIDAAEAKDLADAAARHAAAGATVSEERAREEINLIKEKYAIQRTLEAKAETDRITKGAKTKYELQKNVDDAKKAVEQVTNIQGQYTDEAIQKAKDDLRAAEIALKGTVDRTGEALGLLANAFAQVGGAASGSWGKMLSGAGGLVNQFQEARKLAASTQKQWGAASVMMDKGKSGMERMGAGVQAAGSVIEGVQGVMKAMDQRSRGARALGGAMAGAKAGAAFGPYGMAVGAAAGLVVGLVKGKPAWAKATDEIGRDFGVKVSDELGKAIADDAKKKFKGDRFTAEVANLSKVIQEAGGVTDKNADKLTAKLRDTFSLVETGQLKAEEGRQVLDESFGAFADHVVKSNKIASKSFQEIIALNQSSGLKSKAVTDFVLDQTGRLGANLAKMVAGSVPAIETTADIIKKFSEGGRTQLEKDFKAAQEGSDKYKGSIEDFVDEQRELYKTAEEGDSRLKTSFMAVDYQLFDQRDAKIKQAGVGVERLERLTLAAFNASIKGGASYLDALDQMGPALDKINDANKALGRSGSGAIQELLHFREVAGANKELVESAGSLNEVMLALSNIGALNKDTLADMETQGQETFAQLTGAGFTEQQSLQQMKGYLESVRDAHEQLGIPIDENTQALLDQAEAQGVLSKKQMSTNDIMLEGLGAIIEALGGKLPDAFKKMADAGVDAAKKVGDTMDETVNAAIEDTTDGLVHTPWAGYASKGAAAGAVTKGAIDKVDSSVGGVRKGLDETDWAGWSQEAIDAARNAEDAINGVSMGHSPGGIKEIPLKLHEAMRAFKDWERVGVTSSAAVEAAVDSMQSPATDRAMATMTKSGTTTSGQLAALRQQVGETAYPSQPITFEIKAIDGADVQRVVEEKIQPMLIASWKRGRGITALRELIPTE